MLAHRLMRGGAGDGLYVALSTMATVNAMLARLARSYPRLFAEDADPATIRSAAAPYWSPCRSWKRSLDVNA